MLLKTGLHDCHYQRISVFDSHFLNHAEIQPALTPLQTEQPK